MTYRRVRQTCARAFGGPRSVTNHHTDQQADRAHMLVPALDVVCESEPRFLKLISAVSKPILTICPRLALK